MASGREKLDLSCGPLPDGHEAESKTVLVASSKPGRQTIVADLLTGQGYNVVLASNGEQATVLLGRGGIDLVITALVMTDMDGLELLKAMRDSGLALPVIAVAPGAQKIDQVYAKSALLLGAEKAFLWPLTPLQFLDDVREILKLPAK